MNIMPSALTIFAIIICSTTIAYAGENGFLKKHGKRNSAVIEAESVSVDPDSAVVSVAQTPDSPADELHGEWILYELRGSIVGGEERPYIDIDLSAGRFYGSNGCNVINGNVKADSHDIVFSDLISSRRMCENVPDEYMINTTLTAVRSYVVRYKEHDCYLDLADATGRKVIVLRRHNMEFLNGAWRVTAIDSERNRNEGVELVIDIPEGRIHGNTGCNILNGSLFIDPDRSNSIQFMEISTTRAACPDGAVETAFLVALEEVVSAYAEGTSAVVMVDSRGHEVLRLLRLDLPSD